MHVRTERQVLTPSSIRYAVIVMYLGAVSSVIAALAPLIDRVTGDRLGQDVQAAYPGYTAAETNTEASATPAFLIVAGAIGTLLWLWMARTNAQARRWARVTATVIFAVATMVPLTLGTIPVPGFITVAWWLPCVAVVLLWTPASSTYLRAVRRPRGDV